MILLGLIALIVIPPDKLPEVARQIARFINDFRRSTTGLLDDLKKEAMLKPEDLLKQKVKNVMKPETTTTETTEKKPNE